MSREKPEVWGLSRIVNESFLLKKSLHPMEINFKRSIKKRVI